MNLSLPQLRGHDLLTHSRMQTFRTCPRKHWFQYEKGIRPEGTSKPLRMGSAIHDAIDHFMRGDHVEGCLAETLADTVYDDANADIGILIEGETIEALFRGYVNRWGRTPEVVHSEQSFRTPIVNPDTGASSRTFQLAGKIDRIVKLDDGRLAVLETKTVSESIEPDAPYWRKLELDQQISTYMIAARGMGFDVETVIYDVIRKPSIQPKMIQERDADGLKIVVDEVGDRQYLSNGKPRQSVTADQKGMGWRLLERMESPEEFAGRLADDIASRPDFYYARREIPRLDADIEDMRHELWQQAQVIREAQKTGRWYRNTAACDWKGKCPYLDVCRNARDIDSAPSGFVQVQDIHPELGEEE